MTKKTDDEFEAIVERALAEMARVDASVAEYQDGLKTGVHLFETTLQASIEMDDNEDEG
jgi:hypothetical protein